MPNINFRFTIQPYQSQAVNSVVKVFDTQPFQVSNKFRRDLGNMPSQSSLFMPNFEGDDIAAGYANADITLSEAQIFKNIQSIQQRNNIIVDQDIDKSLGRCTLDVEMETGTGKTYVYIKTMFELNKLYGWSKFIIVVPSIAIREGVFKSFSMMENHFMETYHKKARVFIYNSSNLSELDSFSRSADLQVMIINMQAFNSFDASKNKDGRGGNEAARIIFSERDDFGSRRPIDVIAANKPIIILDEPQKMGGEKTQDALRQFNPLFTLNYSATHKDKHNLVYVLDALDAYNNKLVKKIEVKGFDLENLKGTDQYLYLAEIILSPKVPPRARIELEIKYNKFIKRETRIVDIDDNLYVLSRELEQYKGYHINEISPGGLSENDLGYISFTNGVKLYVGEVKGNISEKDIRRVQIRETIRSHFKKEELLFSRGIKSLSLFFIDKVEYYRKYNEIGEEINSEYGDIFEEEYNHILEEYISIGNTAYSNYLKNIETSKTHTGYFSIDKDGRKVNSKTTKGSDITDDVSAYDLIMKHKERLLSFEEPVRFIFSHSALREGWDNPNIFQICTLKQGGTSTTNKRQEVGRGLRICVDQSGNRMDYSLLGNEFEEINQLTVIASEGYKDFVSSLQREITDVLYERPTKASIEYFEGKIIGAGDYKKIITKEDATCIYFYLVQNKYIDSKGTILQSYYDDKNNDCLQPLEADLVNHTEDIHKLIQAIYNPRILEDMVSNVDTTKIKENPLNDNFYKQEFQKLWKCINHKYTYTVDFDSKELINKSINYINKHLFVTTLQYTVTTGIQERVLSAEVVKSGQAFKESNMESQQLTSSINGSVKYDLVGKVATSTNLTRKTVVKILKSISSKKFDLFKVNPEEFISKVSSLINEQKATMIVEDITYNLTDKVYESEIFTAEKYKDYTKAIKSSKHIQDYIFTDGLAENSVENRFAKSLELDSKVVVYAKLPRGFKIPTPVGNYTPDWAIAFEKDSVKHIFFIAETKGDMSSLSLRPIEQAKISCAKKLFNSLSNQDLVYHEVDSYENLMAVMESI